ncbi:MAG: FAD-binding protein [Armatimonadota bacterium]|nr:FAD-binding protein [Armatimonadota bacterium]MDR7443741.1 FAD-binding protein [Armatimonadota bacterium]MDR7571268.1 FAD-binding protein [Armatimonadota bacterium]MDR7613731.1 FAD-binding protein [Armatimonadota bacterium]
MSDFDYQTDVLIVGSGAAGLVGALVVKEHGFEPLIVEKTAFVGGTTAWSGGGLWIPNNPVSRAAGVQDSLEAALTYLDHVVGEVGPASSPERRRAFLEYGPRMVEFLQRLGFRWRAARGYPDYYPDRPGASIAGRAIEGAIFDGRLLGPWLPRLHRHPSLPALPLHTNEAAAFALMRRTPRGMLAALRVLGRWAAHRLRGRIPLTMGLSLVGQLLWLVLQRGVPIWVESPLLELVVEDGRVVGAEVRHHHRSVRIRARGGVLLAAGGFAHNQEMRERYHPHPISTAWTSAAPADTGDAIRAAQAIGAAVALMDDAWWGPTALTPQGRPLFLLWERSLPFSLIVDASGQRFMNESASYVDCGHRQYERHREVPAIPAWLIIDAKHRRFYPFGLLPPGFTPASATGPGFLVRASGLHELARRCGIDPEGLVRTVERFNRMARTGRDEDFHRGESAYDNYYGDPRVRPNPNLGPLDRPPFYATAVYPGDLGTKGGLLTDAWGRVLREDGTPIAGLYAAGNTSASVMGRTYPGPGATLGPACVFAYISMLHAVQRLRSSAGHLDAVPSETIPGMESLP